MFKAVWTVGRVTGESGLTLASLFIGWLTPRRQLMHLKEKGDNTGWEVFRDGLIRRWSNLNVVCGLIMSAISTILFSSLRLRAAAYAFGVISLLSSLIAIGFGVGLMYVLGDVRGFTLHEICRRYPYLFLFALSLPQVWGGVSFVAFFVVTSLLGWEATGKGWLVKAGVILCTVVLVVHLAAFGFLFRSQDNPEYLIPDRGLTTFEYPEKTTSPKPRSEAMGSPQSAALSEDIQRNNVTSRKPYHRAHTSNTIVVQPSP